MGKVSNPQLNSLFQLGLGGGCHWCTEAVVSSLKGVTSVQQGWISSTKPNDKFSEAVLVSFNEQEIPLECIIEIHLRTHSSTANHSMREKYRSAIYVMNPEDSSRLSEVLSNLQSKFDQALVTQILPYDDFKLNQESYREYYSKNPDKAFCQTYIKPKLKKIRETFPTVVDLSRISI